MKINAPLPYAHAGYRVRHWRRLLASALILGLWLAMPVHQVRAQAPRLLGKYGDWAAHKIDSSRGDVCFVMSEAKAKSPSNLDHGEVYLMVSRRPKENIKGEVMLRVGYRLKNGSSVKASVGKLTINMYTREDGAWLRDADDDAKLVKAMRGGKEITLKGTSLRGNQTSYRFSLNGISAGLDATAGACK